MRVEHSSYAARPAPIGSRMLVRGFEHRIEIRDLRTQALLRTHAKAEQRPGTVVLPDAERVFNPSRETRRILEQAQPSARTPSSCASGCSPWKAASANASSGASSDWPTAIRAGSSIRAPLLDTHRPMALPADVRAALTG